MCEGIDGVSNDSGVTYEVSYNFIYAVPGQDADGKRISGWLTTLSFSDKKTGEIPPDVETYKLNGVRTAIQDLRSQSFANFNILKLGPLTSGSA